MSLGEQFDTILPAARRGAGWALDALYRDLVPSVAGYLRLQGSEDPSGSTTSGPSTSTNATNGSAGGEGGAPTKTVWWARRRLAAPPPRPV